jgi:hypothetical protein
VTDQLLFDVDPQHEALVRLFRSAEDPTPQQLVLRGRERTVELPEQPRSLGAQLLAFVRLGVEHIFTGADHLAFVFGLLLGVPLLSLRRGVGQLVRVVTAFTVAHSVTLALAGLGGVQLPSRLVEPVIALSIAVVALENLLGEAGPRRWLLALGFGLIHGFGFASVLAELSPTPDTLALSLLAFNLGVECGQLCLVALAAPALWLLAQPSIDARARLTIAALGSASGALLLLGGGGLALALVLAGSAVVLPALVVRWGATRVLRQGVSVVLLALALFWSAERLAGASWLGGRLG